MGVLVLTALVVGFILLHRRKRDAKTQPAYSHEKKNTGPQELKPKETKNFRAAGQHGKYLLVQPRRELKMGAHELEAKEQVQGSLAQSAQSLTHDRLNDGTIGSHELEQEDTQIYEAFARPNGLEGGHAHAVETCDEGGVL